MKPPLTVIGNIYIMGRNENYSSGFVNNFEHRMKFCFFRVLVIALWLSILLFSANGQDTFRGSTVAFFRTPEQIVVGADSIAIAANDPSIVTSMCKIIRVANSHVFIATAGLSPQNNTRFNYISYVIEAYRQGKTIKDTANVFSSIIVAPLIIELSELKHDPRINFSADFERKPAISIIFFGFEKGIPVVYQREFIINTAPTGGIEIKLDRADCPGPLCANGEGGNVLGSKTAIQEAMRASPQSFNWKKEDLVVLIERFIRIVINYFKEHPPRKVGEPIQIIRINRKGIRWEKCEPPCGCVNQKSKSQPTSKRNYKPRGGSD